MFWTDGILIFRFLFPPSCQILPTFKKQKSGPEKEKGYAEVLYRGFQQVDRRCPTRRLWIQKGIKGREGRKQDGFFFYHSWEEAFVGIAGAGRN